MSNSIFKEVPDVQEGEKINSNLIITVKKNGSVNCDDNEALQNLLSNIKSVFSRLRIKLMFLCLLLF